MGKDPEEPELVGLFMMCINVFVILLVVYGFVVDTGPAMIQSYYQQYLDVKEAARVAENVTDTYPCLCAPFRNLMVQILANSAQGLKHH